MGSQTTATLRQAIRSVVRADHATATDRELIQRFARDGDQAAFAALVGRHTPMVLGVCRRALPTLQDAEDACQATFLVLAQKAGGQRWQPSVANYLYAVARRIAARVRLGAQRRCLRERRAARPEGVAGLEQLSAREA